MRNQGLVKDQIGTINAIKRDILLQIESTDKRMLENYETRMRETKESINAIVDAQLGPDLKQAASTLRRNQEKMQILDQHRIANSNKLDAMNQVLEDHLDLIHGLNDKLDSSKNIVEQNKLFLSEKLHLFENGVIKELKEATKHLDMEAYEASFRKLEEDIDLVNEDLNRLEQTISTNKNEVE